MSKGLNRVSLIGNLGKDVECKYMPSGGCVANFSLAINDSYKNKDGEKVETTEWVNICAFRKLAEICGEYLRKGSQVYIEGKLKTRSYEKDGQKRYVTEVHADQMLMLGGKDSNQGSRPTSATSHSNSEAAGSGSYEDDIPF